MTEFTGQKNLSINNIEYYLPQKVVTNDDLSAENPEWDMARALKNTGVYRRHIASDNETAFDLGLAACNKLFLVHILDLSLLLHRSLEYYFSVRLILS